MEASMFFNKRKKEKLLDAITLKPNLYYNELPSSIVSQLHGLKSLGIYTKQHIDDVPLQALKICKQLKVDEDVTHFIMISSYLHDVGKIFIPTSILKKNDKLTDEEYEIMKTHAEKSYDVCMQFDDLRKYAKTVRGHHENIDGSGYPDALYDTQVTFEMRVLRVADFYSALKSKREYKDKMPLSQVFEILTDEAMNKKIDSNVFIALIKAVMLEKEYEIANIKTSLEGYNEQLEYNGIILEYLDQYTKKKKNSYEIMKDVELNRYLNKLQAFDITSINDANKLLERINDNIIQLLKNINDTKNAKNDMKILKKCMDKIEKRIG